MVPQNVESRVHSEEKECINANDGMQAIQASEEEIVDEVEKEEIQNEDTNVHSYAMDMQASINENRNDDEGIGYHVFDAEATHGTAFDALKGGTKLVALLLYHPPSLQEGHPPTLALHLVWRKLLTFMELMMNMNPG